MIRMCFGGHYTITIVRNPPPTIVLVNIQAPVVALILLDKGLVRPI